MGALWLLGIPPESSLDALFFNIDLNTSRFHHCLISGHWPTSAIRAQEVLQGELHHEGDTEVTPLSRWQCSL